MKINNRLIKGLCFLLCCISHLAQANNVDTLHTQQQLTIKVSLAEKQLVANQQANLVVEVASTSPFSGDFTLPYIELNDAVVIQPDKKTQLDMQEIDGQRWYVQRKKIIIYPLKSGEFLLPSLPVDVLINHQEQTKISGQLTTEPYTFEVQALPELERQSQYIASDNVSFTMKEITNEGNKTSPKDASNIGDAMTYQYQIKADHMHAIMLPKLDIADIAGVQIYKKPRVEKDVFDRFEKFNSAQSSIAVTYIFQQEGTFTLPEQRIVWWDTKKQQLIVEIIKSKTVNVGDTFAIPFNTNHLLTALYGLLVIGFIGALIWQLKRHKKALSASFHRINGTQSKQLSQRFETQIQQQQYSAAVLTLYRICEIYTGSVKTLAEQLGASQQPRLEQLMQLAFDAENSNHKPINAEDTQQLLAAAMRSRKANKKNTGFRFIMQLNPGAKQ